MTQADTRKNFFRQSGWMMVANLMCGVFMMFVHPFAAEMPKPEYALFTTVLRIFVIATIPAVALQVILAQQTAAAITEQAQRDVSATARGLLKLSFCFWLVLMVIAAVFRKQFAAIFGVNNPSLIWATMFLILAALWMPLFQGLLQGMQNFLPLGWSMIVNGIGRVSAIAVGVVIFHVEAAGAVIAAFIGVMCAVAMAAWPARAAFRPLPGKFDRLRFFKKLGPLTAGAGSALFLISIALPLVKARFPEDVAAYYAGAETVGLALVTLCVPVAAVMFPKLVRSRASGSSSDALRLAVIGTVILGGAAALVCTLFPELPMRIMFFRTPDMVKASVLIPWFMWAMIPVTMYNLLLNSLIARDKYAILPFAAAVPIAYAVALQYFLSHTTMAPFDAFRSVIQILMGFSSALLLVSIYFSLRASREDAVATHSGTTAATP